MLGLVLVGLCSMPLGSAFISLSVICWWLHGCCLRDFAGVLLLGSGFGVCFCAWGSLGFWGVVFGLALAFSSCCYGLPMVFSCFCCF